MSEKDNPISERSEKLPQPTELTGISLDKSLPVSSPTKNEKESSQAPTPQTHSKHEEKFPFLSFIHDHVWAGMQFAEQKAAFVFAADSAFLGYLVATMPPYFVRLDRLQQILIVTALIFLITSIGTVVSTITPRLAGHVKGLVYFGAIATRENAEQYISEVIRATQPEFDSAVAHHIFEMAGICNRKQKLIKWAIWLGLIGFVAGMVWLAVVRITSIPSTGAAPDHWDH